MKTLIKETVIVTKYVTGSLITTRMVGVPLYKSLGNCFVGPKIRSNNLFTYVRKGGAIIITPMVDGYFKLKREHFA